MATAEHDDVVFETATREEIRAELARLTDDALGLSAEQFVEQLGSGDLDSFDPTVARLAVLARLLTV